MHLAISLSHLPYKMFVSELFLCCSVFHNPRLHAQGQPFSLSPERVDQLVRAGADVLDIGA